MQTIKELYAYRTMIASLVRRDLKGRYKGSVLGFFWTFFKPADAAGRLYAGFFCHHEKRY